jgi:hypothetical protein
MIAAVTLAMLAAVPGIAGAAAGTWTPPSTVMAGVSCR